MLSITPRLRKINGKRMITTFLIAYVSVMVATYLNQRNLMYVPYQVFPNPALIGVGDMQEIRVATADNLTLRALYRAPALSDQPVIVHFHGNGGSIAIRGNRARYYIDHGYGYMLAEYRGYASNPGKPSEQGLYEDARGYINWLLQQEGMQQNQIVLYGESLGTGIATQMALEFPAIQAVILEAPYTTMQAVAQTHMFWLPAYWLVRDRYNNIDKIAQVQAPVLVLHGQKDRVVPFRHGNAVFQKVKSPKRFEIFSEANHINLYNHGAGDKVRDFLAAHRAD